MKQLALAFALLSFAFSGQAAQAGGTETFVGIGVTIAPKNRSFQITELVADGPARASGVTVGEWIVGVNQQPTERMKLDEVVKLIGGGAVGTRVTLTLREREGDTTRDLDITRGLITIQCVLKGTIHLSLLGDLQFGTLSGYIGEDHVRLTVSDGRVTGIIDQDFVHLTADTRFGSNVSITGWIRSTYVNWDGFGHLFTGYQNCIR